MVRHRGSKDAATRKRPKRTFSLMSLGTRTKGWDKNPPPRDCPYGTFGKRMQRSIMGFGSLATAMYMRELVSEVILNESHGTLDPGKSNMRYFHERLGHHKENATTEYKTMYRAVEALFNRFPDIKRNVTQANADFKPLIAKIRKVMAGAHAARNADANVIRRDIFTLAHDDAKKRGWTMPATIEKSHRGIKSESTARFLLPFADRDEYLKEPEAYREKVERNQIKLSLTGTWSAILYDEDMVDDDNELSGLFRSETLLRCGVTIMCSPSAGRGWKYPEPGARSFAASQKESNAEINGIKKITPEAIAYISTLVVFAVHDSNQFSRDLGGIDLSELYHDVVGVLRTKTEWAAKTLEFWNKIFFGDREDEEHEPRINREGRLKQLEAKQREREGLAEVNTRPCTPSVMPPVGRQSAQDQNNSPPGSLPPDSEDEEPTTARRSQGSSCSRQPVSQQKAIPIPQSKPGLKRKIATPDSDSDSSDSGNAATPPRSKKVRQRPSTTPQPTANKGGRQACEASPTPPPDRAGRDEPDPANRVDIRDWEDVREGIKNSIKRATAAGLKEISAELSKVVSMSAKKGTRHYNANYDRLEWFKTHVDGKYERVSMADPIMQENESISQPAPPNSGSPGPGPVPESPAPTAKRPPPKKKAPRKARKAIARTSNQAMPPPRVTRSTTAQLSRQQDDAELDPPTDPEEPAAPPIASARKKLSVGPFAV